MKTLGLIVGCMALLASGGPAPGAAPPSAQTQDAPPGAAAPVSGIDLQYVDDSVRPQDDFYQYINEAN